MQNVAYLNFSCNLTCDLRAVPCWNSLVCTASFDDLVGSNLLKNDD